MVKKIIRLVIGLVIVGAGVGVLLYIYSTSGRQNLSASLDSIQVNLSEVVATKEIGDLLAAKKTPPANYTWPEVGNLSTTMAGQIGSLKTNYRLAEYKKAGTVWAVKIREAANDQKTWNDLPAMPGNFTVLLRDSEAEELFYNCLAKISELTQFGADAIRRQDRETMRYIAAKFSVQEHWLNGLANYGEAGFFTKLVKPVYAKGNHFYEDKWEFDRVQADVLHFKNIAQAYYMAENVEKNKAAAGEWKKAAEEWAGIVAKNDLAPQVLAELMKMAEKQSPEEIFIQEWAKIVAGSDLAPQVLAELIKNEEDKNKSSEQLFVEKWAEIVAKSDLAPQVLAELMKNSEKQPPPQVKAFRDDCLARGGVLGGIDRTNEWLQTVEDGFYCRYKEDGEKCWRFLSYSGSIGAGGEPECEQENVLPTPTGPNEALAQTRPVQQQAAETPASKAEPSSQTQTSTKQPTQPTTPKPTTPKPTTPKPTTPKTPLGDLGTPTGTAAPKIEFTLSQSNFNAQVGERFQYSFCQPAVTRTSDLCTAASTNPKNGLPPYSFSLESGVGFLPFGLNLNLNGLLEGTPTAAGSRTFSVCAKDTGGFSVCRNVTVNVAQKETKNSCYYEELGESPSYSGQPRCCQHHSWCNGPDYCCEENGCQCDAEATQPQADEPVAPTPEEKAPTGTISIESGSCVFKGDHQGYNIYEIVSDFDFQANGSVSISNSDGGIIDFGKPYITNISGLRISCGSWTLMDGKCVRQAGQPEATSWSLYFPIEWFDHVTSEFLYVSIKTSEGYSLKSASQDYTCQ